MQPGPSVHKEQDHASSSRAVGCLRHGTCADHEEGRQPRENEDGVMRLTVPLVDLRRSMLRRADDRVHARVRDLRAALLAADVHVEPRDATRSSAVIHSFIHSFGHCLPCAVHDNVDDRGALRRTR